MSIIILLMPWSCLNSWNIFSCKINKLVFIFDDDDDDDWEQMIETRFNYIYINEEIQSKKINSVFERGKSFILT